MTRLIIESETWKLHVLSDEQAYRVETPMMVRVLHADIPTEALLAIVADRLDNQKGWGGKFGADRARDLAGWVRNQQRAYQRHVLKREDER